MRRGTTYARLKRLMSHLSAVMRDRKADASDFVLKLLSGSPAYPRVDSEEFEETQSQASAAAWNRKFPRRKVEAAHFDYLKVIGKGSFGKVLLARHKETDVHYAVKVLQKSTIQNTKQQGQVMCERSVLLQTLDHPFLVRLHYSFQTSEKLYFVLDYASGGELFYHLQRERVFLEPRARFYAAEIASALGYLHTLRIIYRDLKLENVLLDRQGHVLLTDFGLCKEGVGATGHTGTFCGTPEYLPPEVLQQREYGPAVDWWGLGVVLHEMLYGLPPFYSEHRSEMMRNILQQPLSLGSGVSKRARDLLSRLLQKEPEKRLHKLSELECHSFFSPIKWVELLAKKVPPPFTPAQQTCPGDLVNFDPEFTELPVPLSLGVCGEADLTFSGFSYTCDNAAVVSPQHGKN
ncbi:serine/threonine-protein kinase Sgk2b isoform X3 [Denticeps clupeoides]|nr:serine/threonine-protein kinase Sgk1-like isoform X3 [Denticeps clupeoides]